MRRDLIGLLGRLVFPAAYREFRQWHVARCGRQPPLLPLVKNRISRLWGSPYVGQIVSRELLHPIYMRLWTSDCYVYDQIFVDREYDIDVPDPALIVDAGANIGLSTAYFASRFPRATIIAIEPELANFDWLVKNTRPYPNVDCLQAAVWHRTTNVGLMDPTVEPWLYQFDESSSDKCIPGVSLDELMHQKKIEHIDLLKLDIEGAEKNIFECPGKWIDATGTIVVESHDRMIAGCTQAIQAAAQKHSYASSQHGENIVLRRMDAS